MKYDMTEYFVMTLFIFCGVLAFGVVVWAIFHYPKPALSILGTFGGLWIIAYVWMRIDNRMYK